MSYRLVFLKTRVKLYVTASNGKERLVGTFKNATEAEREAIRLTGGA